jgi:serine/threonine protein kinase/WD40 repeat protein
VADANCPPREEIRAFLSDQLPDSSAEKIRAHLLECDRCETIVRELEQADPFLGELRRMAGQSRPDSVGPDDNACRDALDQVKSTVRNQLGQITEAAGSRDTTEVTSLSGKRLHQYELLEPIGKGGMGEVYKALHLPLHRYVAIKVLPPRQRGEKEHVIRFLRETETLGDVDRHAHIVYATDAGEADGVYYLVMELVDGRDLSQLLTETGGPLAAHDACAIIRHVALALSYLHGRQLVHRDVKPSNVILSNKGTAKLLDLGLAKLLRADDGRLTDPTRIVGSLQYSAPEQVSDVGQIGPATDIYGLGATFYELLTGDPPLSLGNDDSLVRTIVSQSPAPVSDYRSDVAGEVDELLCAMLAKEPENRPSAPDVAKMLERHTADCNLCAPSRADPATIRRGISSGRTTQVAQVASCGNPKPKRSAVRAGIVACCVLLVLLFLVGWRTMWSRPSEHPARLTRATDAVIHTATWQPGPRVFPGLIPTPARLPGVNGWQVDTVLPRSSTGYPAWDPTGKLFAVPCDSGYVRVYELCDSQLKLRMMLPHAESVYFVAWSPDGGSLASLGPSATLSIWQVGDATAMLRQDTTAHQRGETYAAWHPTNNTLATCGGDGTLKLWDAEGTLLSTSGLSEKPLHCLAWSSDGSSLLVGGGDGQLRRAMNTPTMTWQTIANVGFPIRALAWHPSDDLVAIGTENAGIQLRATDGELLQSFTELGNSVKYAMWRPDGAMLAVGADSLSTADFAQERLTIGTGRIDKAHEAAWNPADQSLVWCTRNGIRRYCEASAGGPSNLTSSLDRRIQTVEWHPSGNSFATAETDSVVRVWGRDGTPMAAVRAHEGEVPSVAWSPNGLFLATCGGWGGADWTVRLWHNEDLSLAFAFPRLHEAAVLDVAWSHDSVYLASASDDHTVRLWDTKSRKPGPILRGHHRQVLAVGWNSEERLLSSGGLDHTIRVWDVRNAGEIDRLSSPREFEIEASWIRSIRWSPDNSRIAYAGFSSVTLINASTGERIWSHGPAQHAGSLSWHPEGNRIACGKWGYLDAARGFLQEVALPYKVAFDPTGRLLAAGGWNSIVQMWDTEQDRVLWLAILLTDKDSAVFTAAGELLNSHPRVDEQLIYILRDEQGRYSLSTPADFRDRFNL